MPITEMPAEDTANQQRSGDSGIHPAQPRATTPDGFAVFCGYDALVPVESLVENPRNPNMHPDSQLKLLGEIIRGNGWRQPITVSKRSGFIVKGHGRYQAAKLIGCSVVPVDYQNYSTEAEEWADMVADNRIAELAEMDDKSLASLLEERPHGTRTTRWKGSRDADGIADGAIARDVELEFQGEGRFQDWRRELSERGKRWTEAA